MIAVTSCIKSRGWILPYFLQNLYDLDWPRQDISLIFLDDASDDNSGKILDAFALKHQDEYASITLLKNNVPFDRNNNSRDTANRPALYKHLAELRNILIEKCIALRAGMQLSVDCDILVTPWLLKQLAKHNLPYVSTIILNDNSVHFKHPFDYVYPRGRFTNFAPALSPARLRSKDGVEIVADHLVFAHRLDYPMNSLCQVGMSGACYLVDSTALYSGARFGQHPFGEDAWLSLELQARGIPIYVDTTLRAIHVMEKKYLKAGLQAFEALKEAGER